MKKRFEKIIPPIIESEGLVFKKVEVEKKDGKIALTVTIDKKDGKVDVNDCSKISKLIDPIIEEEDFFDGESYLLIVSSPGS